MKLFKRHKQPDNLRVRQPVRRDGISGSGSLSQPSGPNRTFSYYASRSQTDINTGREAVQSKPPLRRLPSKLQRLRKHAGWLVLTLVLLAFVIFQLQLSTTPKVVTLSATSDAPFLQDSDVYQQAARKLFNDSAGNRNKLTVNANDIAARMQKQFPELQEVSIALPVLGDKPTVYVRPADPAMVLTATNGSYIIDENGRALAEATAGINIGRLKIPTVTDQSSLDVKLGQQVLPRSAIGFIGNVVRQLRAQQIDIQSMTLPAAAGELNVYIAGKPYFVRFNLLAAGKDAAAAQAGAFIAVNKRLGREGSAPAEYIDVRLEGRAYYK